jgi:hypothetical protein
MSKSKEVFSCAGVARNPKSGQMKVCFSHDLAYVKKLEKAGKKDAELRQYNEAGDEVSKPVLVSFLKTTDLYTDTGIRFSAEIREAIDVADAKYNGEKPVKTVKVSKAKAAPSLDSVKAKVARAKEADAA